MLLTLYSRIARHAKVWMSRTTSSIRSLVTSFWPGRTELILKGDTERSLQAMIVRVMTVMRVKAQQKATTTPPGLPGTSRSTAVGAEDAALAPGGWAMASESMDPAGRRGNTVADEDASGQGDAGHVSGGDEAPTVTRLPSEKPPAYDSQPNGATESAS